MQSPSPMQPVLHAVAEPQINEPGQGLGLGVQACALSHLLVVKVEPAHVESAHEVPLDG